MDNRIRVDTSFLCVDDEKEIRERLIQDLRSMDFTGRIYEARSGNEAFEILVQYLDKQPKIDFLISDIVMLGSSGIELLKKVRGDARFNHIPILMLTSVNSKEVVMECLNSGATNYLLKPWSLKSLAEKIIFCWEKFHPPT